MWSRTFERFTPGRVPLVGPIAVIVSDWTRPRTGQSRMFELPAIERLTFAQPWWPLALFGSVGLVSVAVALLEGVTPLVAASGYLAGLFVWTLVEYGMHRFSFHHAPTSERQVAFGYLVHGVHHAYPDDPRRWVMPLVVTLPIGIALFSGMYAALGIAGLSAFAGFAHGYVTYDTVHWAIHRNVFGTRLGRYLRRHHLQHHHATPDRRYGVSSPIWDVVFRTLQ